MEKILYCEAPITFETAVLGGSIKIPTLESYISLKIPASTQTGKIFRVHGKGATSVHDSSRGDLLCRVVVETPENLSSEQIDVFKKYLIKLLIKIIQLVSHLPTLRMIL